MPFGVQQGEHMVRKNRNIPLSSAKAREYANAHLSKEEQKHRYTNGVLISIRHLAEIGFYNGIFYVPKRGLVRLTNDLKKLGFVTNTVIESSNGRILLEVEWNRGAIK